MMAKKNVSLEVRVKIDEIKQKLKLPKYFSNIYLLSGKSIFEMAQIPKNESVIIISMIIFYFQYKNDVGDQSELKNSHLFLNNPLVKEFNEYFKKPEISVYSRSEVHENLYTDRENVMEQIKNKAKTIIKDLRAPNDLDLENLQEEIDFSKPM